ncbi:MAG: TetR/AcrR family transcriptional regulator [Anaerolineales bacterium]|nr:TetR/AcrR family transcriptional regulator [Anaerolineales bacterium]
MGDAMNEANKDEFLPSAETTISPQKQAILEIAQGLFAEQGYAGLSIRDLADHCGLAKATVYHHFRDKQELFLIVLEQEMLSLQAAIIAAAAEQASALDKLRAVVYTFCRIIAERRLIIMSTLHATPEVATQLRAYLKGIATSC